MVLSLQILKYFIVMTQKISQKKVFKIQKRILYVAKFLEAISPKAAARFSFLLFTKPVKFKRPRREGKMYHESQKEMLAIPSLGKKVRVYEYGSSEEKILLIHGWSGRGTQLFSIAEHFLKKGLMCISFDGTAHGESDGKMSNMTEFIKIICEINRQYGPFKYAVGHSLGGMALLNAVKEGFSIEKAALVSSGNSIKGITKQFISRLGLKNKVAVLLKKELDKKLGDDSEKLSAYMAAKEVKIPVLVVHDRDDQDVKVACAHDIVQYLSKGEVYITEGLGHRRILYDNKVIQKIDQFFSKD